MTERPTLEDRFVARMLVDDYGVARSNIGRVIPLVQAARRAGLIHAEIVASVRGVKRSPLTDTLSHCLEEFAKVRSARR
jgi:hypothetical protein